MYGSYKIPIALNLNDITYSGPDKLFAVLHKNPVEPTREIQLIAAAKWYEAGLRSCW